MSGPTHECPAPGCRVRISRDRLACPRHWFAIPKPLRDDVWEAWRAGDSGRHTEAIKAGNGGALKSARRAMNDALHIAIAEMLRAALIAALLSVYGLTWLMLHQAPPPHIIDPDPTAHPFSREKGRVGCAPIILDDWLCFRV